MCSGLITTCQLTRGDEIKTSECFKWFETYYLVSKVDL